MTYPIVLTSVASEQLLGIADRRVKEKIADRIAGLARDPEKQGRALRDELAGFRSLRAAGQRYRIIYKVDGSRVIVLVATVGIRREGSREDVYALARKLIRSKLV